MRGGAGGMEGQWSTPTGSGGPLAPSGGHSTPCQAGMRGSPNSGGRPILSSLDAKSPG